MEDQEHLASFERQGRIIRDRVRSVISKTGPYHQGFYLTGPPGSGKSYMVREALVGVPHIYQRGCVASVGLYRLLKQQPGGLFVLDDSPLVFRQPATQQVLLGALDGEPGQPRLVTYTGRSRESFRFTGGIIAISNLPLPLDSMGDAIRSRIPVVRHQPTNEELAAVMRHQASQGYAGLSAAQCLEVVDLLLHETASRGYRVDLRIFRSALRDRLFFERGEAESHWQDLVRSLVQSRPVEAPDATSKQEELAAERELLVALDLEERYPGDTARQLRESGMKKSKFYQLRRSLGLGRRGRV